MTKIISISSTAALTGAFLTAFSLSGCSAGAPPPVKLASDVILVASAPSAVDAAHAPLPEPDWEVTPEVERELHVMLGRERFFLQHSLERRDRYMPVIQQIFKDEGVPASLLNLAFVESGYDVDARSRAGAVGMWQFIRSTARIYGLKIDRHEDQRTDLVLSSIAAARHLRDLYSTYQDWHLALAAYNAGSGGISRALVRGNADDYWSLVHKRLIANETARYVPKIIAVWLITKNLAKYNLETLAQNLDWLRQEKGGSTEVAHWSGDRRPSAG